MGTKEPKQFLTLEGRPILHWTLENLIAVSGIDAICVVVPASHLEQTKKELGQAPWKSKIHWIVEGGKERQNSVIRGFRKIPICDMVLVHDAVRPFVVAKQIRDLLQLATEKGAVILGLPVKETIKEIRGENEVVRTVDRNSLWSIQTPQVFRYAVLKEAIDRAEKESFLGTDEAMLVERIGHPVFILEGSPLNIKITRPDDLILAEGVLHAYRNRL